MGDRIVVVNKATGEAADEVYLSAGECAVAYGVGRGLVRWCCESRSLPRESWYTFRYEDDWDSEEVIEGDPNAPVACFLAGRFMFVASNAGTAALVLGMSRRMVLDRCADGKPHGAWTVRRMRRMGEFNGEGLVPMGIGKERKEGDVEDA